MQFADVVCPAPHGAWQVAGCWTGSCSVVLARCLGSICSISPVSRSPLGAHVPWAVHATTTPDPSLGFGSGRRATRPRRACARRGEAGPHKSPGHMALSRHARVRGNEAHVERVGTQSGETMRLQRFTRPQHLLTLERRLQAFRLRQVRLPYRAIAARMTADPAGRGGCRIGTTGDARSVMS